MSDAATGTLPSLAEALAWTGRELDDVGGTPVGLVAGVYADAETGAPVWLAVVLLGRRRPLPFLRRRVKTAIVPLRECAAMPGRVWTAQTREAIRTAPTVDPSRPLLREHEATICLHYGIGETIGRHAEIDSRAVSSASALPAFQ